MSLPLDKKQEVLRLRIAAQRKLEELEQLEKFPAFNPSERIAC